MVLPCVLCKLDLHLWFLKQVEPDGKIIIDHALTIKPLYMKVALKGRDLLVLLCLCITFLGHPGKRFDD